jgi:hypothetical protein
MAEPNSSPPRRVGGSPTFVAAHGIKDHTDLSFEDAYALARLVLEEGGGPVSTRRKKDFIKKATETKLVQLGMIEVHGGSETSIERAYVQVNIGDYLGELLEARFAGVKVVPESYVEQLRWSAKATQAGFDLVARHLPVAPF